MTLLTNPTRYLFFTGKGGVGKTSIACATALSLADVGQRVLLVSTDPASNLDQVLATRLFSSPTAISGATGLDALNIDPEAAAQAYRDRALAPLLGVATDREIADLTEQLSGACTVEIAAFDEFTSLLTDPVLESRYDHVIFDTAPTGHTLRLLSLPAAWSTFIDVNPGGTSCLGPNTARQAQQAQYSAAVAALADSERTTLVLVTRPERGALNEAARTSGDLREMGMRNQQLVINGVFRATAPTDQIATALERRGDRALQNLPAELRDLPSIEVPLQPFNIVGLNAIRGLLTPAEETGAAVSDRFELPCDLDLLALSSLVDDLAAIGKGLIMVMGKGGVGKTTIAAAIAVELATRGKSVHLTTTDPAAHIASTVDGAVPNLQIGRIDPKAERDAYVQRVMASKGAGLNDEQRALLLEDLQSPCTEEVAVFHAFSRMISKARSEFVVLDTAPTGHTLLLLDTTGAYHQEILRSMEGQQGVSRTTTPLMRLRDASYTHVVIVTLPETTPVQDASQLQDDLRRADIEPYAWVINSSFAATGTADPVLLARAAEEVTQIRRVKHDLARRAYLVPWLPEEPVGPARLRALAERKSVTALS